MKKKLILILATLMCVSLCSCGNSDSTSDNNTEIKKEESTSASNTNTETDLVNKDLTYNDLRNMTVDEMKQYYNEDELIGTPTMEFQYVSCKGRDADTFRVTRRIEVTPGEIYHHVENTIRLGECLQPYYCIFVDNNTPDNYEDDQFAYIFYWVEQ